MRLGRVWPSKVDLREPLEDGVEPVEKRDPVIQVSSREGPP